MSVVSAVIAGYDAVDETGRPLGFFRKDFGASLLRTDISFLPFHFAPMGR